MFFKKMSLLAAIVVSSFQLTASAKHFELPVLLHAEKPMYDMSEVADKMSYYDFVRQIVGPRMQLMAPKIRLNNEIELMAGRGVSVKLSENNFNVHVNFPNAPTGGRSYGWTGGEVGDWSDAMYLDNLFETIKTSDSQEVGRFYELIIEMIGASQAEDIETLRHENQLVANNFLAIYTAEAYRALVPDGRKNWDEALLETTLLGAFHGGQSKLTKVYMGKMSATSKKQDAGVYNRGKPGVKYRDAKNKAAEMRDYWQFSADPESKRSGINITRRDFEKMGEILTRYERSVVRNPHLEKIFKVVGGDRDNVIKSISKFFTSGSSKDVLLIDQLAKDISALMLDIHDHADEITAWALRQN